MCMSKPYLYFNTMINEIKIHLMYKIFCIQLYSIGHLVKDYFDNERKLHLTQTG